MGFERWTERARQVIVLAQEEARSLRHNFIGTEHLLLGLLREEHGVAARALASLGITPERVRAKVVGLDPQGEEVTKCPIPFTQLSDKVLELSLREALALGHNYIGTEHVLLGLTRKNEGVGAQILGDLGADSEKIRKEVIRILSGGYRRSQKDPEREKRWFWVWVQHANVEYRPADTPEAAAIGYAKDRNVPYGTRIHVATESEAFAIGLEPAA